MKCRRCAFLQGQILFFVGETLLTADNPAENKDALLLGRLGIKTIENPVP
jgi:hypothetical protein